MAIAFVAATPSYLYKNSAFQHNFHVTVAAWFKPTAVTATNRIASMSNLAANWWDCWQLTFYGAEANDPLRFTCRGGEGDTDYAYINGVQAGVWQHAAGVARSKVLPLEVYLNGSGPGTDLGIGLADQIATMDRTGIGVSFNNGSANAGFTGSIAEVAVWNEDLTATEIAILAKGLSPLFIKPQNLVLYIPLVRNYNDVLGDYTMTAEDTPTVSEHPRILYPIRPRTFEYMEAGGGGLSIPVAMASYRRRR